MQCSHVYTAECIQYLGAWWTRSEYRVPAVLQDASWPPHWHDTGSVLAIMRPGSPLWQRTLSWATLLLLLLLLLCVAVLQQPAERSSHAVHTQPERIAKCGCWHVQGATALASTWVSETCPVVLQAAVQPAPVPPSPKEGVALALHSGLCPAELRAAAPPAASPPSPNAASAPAGRTARSEQPPPSEAKRESVQVER